MPLLRGPHDFVDQHVRRVAGWMGTKATSVPAVEISLIRSNVSVTAMDSDIRLKGIETKQQTFSNSFSATSKCGYPHIAVLPQRTSEHNWQREYEACSVSTLLLRTTAGASSSYVDAIIGAALLEELNVQHNHHWAQSTTLDQQQQQALQQQSQHATKTSFQQLRITPLHLACHHNCPSIAIILLGWGASATLVDVWGLTPFFAACRGGAECVVAELLRGNHATVHQLDSHLRSPLHVASQHNQDNVIRVVLAAGAQVGGGVGGVEWWQCLAHACATGNTMASRHGNKVILTLRNTTCNVLSPLHWAAASNSLAAMAALKNGGAKLDHVCGAVAFREALPHEVVAMLQVKQEVLTMLDGRGVQQLARVILRVDDHHCHPDRKLACDPYFTALHSAVVANAQDAAQWLISNGVDTNVLGSCKWMPLQLAVGMKRVNIVRSLLEHGTALNQLRNAYQDTPFSIIYLACRSSLYYSRNFRRTIGDCISGGWKDPLDARDGLVRLLLAYGADVDSCPGRSSFIPLHFASEHKLTGVLAALLEHGASVDATDRSGNVALHYAFRRSSARQLCQGSLPFLTSFDVVMLLLANGANPNASEQQGWTPLHLAVSKNQVKIARLLLLYGARVDAVNMVGKKPLEYVRADDDGEMREMLVLAGADPQGLQKGRGRVIGDGAMWGYADAAWKNLPPISQPYPRRARARVL